MTRGGIGAAPRTPFSAWLHHHRESSRQSAYKLFIEPLSTLITFLMVGIALALPASLLLTLDNLQNVAGTGSTAARFSLLLTDETDQVGAQAVEQALREREAVVAVELVTREQALASFISATGLGAALDSLSQNPLPHTLLVKPDPNITGSALEALATELQGLAAVDELVFDTLWQSRLEATLDFGRRLAWGLGMLMAIGAVLVLANTVRLGIESRRDEIIVIKLIGGGDAYARRPFLYTGLWSGVGGGITAVLLVSMLFHYVAPPVESLLALYGNPFELEGLGFGQTLSLLVAGAGLGLGSAWQAAGLHLRHMEPR